MGRKIRAAKPGCLPQPLLDQCKDRKVVELVPPIAEALSYEMCIPEKGKPDLELLRKHLEQEGALDQNLMFELLEEAADLFDREPTMLKLEDPINIVGDIHGQFWDLMRMFEVGGQPGQQQYLFLGDYVDRGSFSIEVTAYLLACKVRYPSRLFMLRGNHECRQMTAFFNFREECEYKYDLSIYNAFMEVFDTLPLCATINNKYFAVHGGISPQMVHLSDLKNIDRMQEPPKEGLVCDLIWSDPNEKEETGKVSEAFSPNTNRGCSVCYSAAAAARFLKRNGMLSILRAHEAQAEGYKMHKTNPVTGFPSVITIFSAPNYCDTYGNKAAIIKLDNSTLNVMQYNHAPHPYFLPNYMDVFGWSMPFVIEKILDFATDISGAEGSSRLPDVEIPAAIKMLVVALQSGNEVEARSMLAELWATKNMPLTRKISRDVDDDPLSPLSPGGSTAKVLSAQRAKELKGKIRAIGRMSRMFKTLREENDVIVKLKGICPGHRIPFGALTEGKERLTNDLEVFGYMRKVDSINEGRPEEEMPMMMTKTLSLHRRKSQQRPTYMQEVAARQAGAYHNGANE